MAGTDSYTASVNLWAGNYAPRNWSFCLGQMIPVSQEQALFSIIGCYFGGDCRSVFALPDMRGRVPLGVDRNKYQYGLGIRRGFEHVILSLSELPAHNHTAAFTPDPSNQLYLTGEVALPVETDTGAGTSDPTGKYFGNSGITGIYYTDYTAGKTMASVSFPLTGSALQGNVHLGYAGQSDPKYFDIIQPYTALNFIICITGLYPPRA